MSKRLKMMMLWLTAAVIIWAVYIFGFIDKTPFDDLQWAEIKYAKVTVNPPGETMVVNNTEKMVSLMQDIKVTRRSLGFYFGNGQATTTFIEFTDGEVVEILSFGKTYIVIDGRYYKADEITNKRINQWVDSLF